MKCGSVLTWGPDAFGRLAICHFMTIKKPVLAVLLPFEIVSSSSLGFFLFLQVVRGAISTLSLRAVLSEVEHFSAC